MKTSLSFQLVTDVLMNYLIASLGDQLCPEAQQAWKNLLQILVDVIVEEQSLIFKNMDRKGLAVPT